MPEKEPLEKLLDQIAIALQSIYNNRDHSLKGQATPTVTVQLQQLEQIANLLEKTYQDTIANSTTSTPNPENIDPKTKEIVDKTKVMQNLINSLRKDIVQRQKVLEPKALSGDDKIGLGQKRKKSAAKNIGHKGWQRL